ncbi:MAG: TonB-dependent receptor [Flavobacteriales bacterium]|nr:TonB-dependent receptor [Flavobacteriales bacterium]MCB9448992.1 TonB-dependent receptor [Flavobacteriales bacterium]
MRKLDFSLIAMFRFLLTCTLALLAVSASAQHTFTAIVKDKSTGEALPGATVLLKGTSNGGAADVNGKVSLTGIPSGSQTLVFSYVGYESQEKTYTFPLASSQPVTIMLTGGEELEEVVISSTRTNNRIEDIPTRVEVLGAEEMQEENGIVPGNMASLLGDLSVIHIQQTSSVSGNMVVRMQGMDSKYTQMLRDGLPIYGGFSGNLGILQIPPLDLKQVEIIKGTSSTLYGGDAISGIINFISRDPGEDPELSFTLNQTTLNETNLNAYYAAKKDRTGVTLFAGSNRQLATDVNGDGLSDVPGLSSMLFHPRLFFDLGKRTHLKVGLAGMTEDRKGGDMKVLENRPDSLHGYLLSNISQRYTADADFTVQADNKAIWTFKGAASSLEQTTTDDDTTFSGRQVSSYSELSYYLPKEKHEWVMGGNVVSEDFRKLPGDTSLLDDFRYVTLGLFAQDDWKVMKNLTAEMGLRTDFHNTFGAFFLPRVSLFWKPSDVFNIRASAGTGYKAPDVFTQSTFSGNLNNIEPVAGDLASENAFGTNMDLTYNKLFDNGVSLQVDQAFYYTKINDPIVSTLTTANHIRLDNAPGYLESIGTDSYVQLHWKQIELYAGFNHTLAQNVDSITTHIPYSPQTKVSGTFLYEPGEHWAIGIEYSFVGDQYIGQNQAVDPYHFVATMVRYQTGNWTFVLNGENMLNVQQTDFAPVYSGSIRHPHFNPIWAPVSGRVINAAVVYKLRLGA